jgi:alpha-glucosidase
VKALTGSRVVRADGHGIDLSLADGAAFSVQVLEPTLMRVRYRAATGYKETRTWAIAPQRGQDVPWQGRARDDLQGFSCAAATLTQVDGNVRLDTGQLSVTLRPEPLMLHWADGQGRTLVQDRGTSAYFTSPRTGAVRHYLQRDRAERYYGLGDKTGPLNLHGRRLRTLALDSLGYDPKNGDPLYKHWPFVLTRAANGAWWGIYYDTLVRLHLRPGLRTRQLPRPVPLRRDRRWRPRLLPDGRQYAGRGDRAVRAPDRRHPPAAALVARVCADRHGSGRRARRPAAARQLHHAHRVRGHPLLGFHYGSGYSSRGKRRYVFTWNGSKFPDPENPERPFSRQRHACGGQHQALPAGRPPGLRRGARQGGFIHDAHSGQPVIEQFWDGMGSHLDFTHPAVVAWWQNSLKSQVLDFGIDVGWNDNNEYAVMDDDARCTALARRCRCTARARCMAC